MADHKLKLGSLTALVIGSMIGGGIFSLPKDMASGAEVGAVGRLPPWGCWHWRLCSKRLPIANPIWITGFIPTPKQGLVIISVSLPLGVIGLVHGWATLLT